MVIIPLFLHRLHVLTSRASLIFCRINVRSDNVAPHATSDEDGGDDSPLLPLYSVKKKSALLEMAQLPESELVESNLWISFEVSDMCKPQIFSHLFCQLISFIIMWEVLGDTSRWIKTPNAFVQRVLSSSGSPQ